MNTRRLDELAKTIRSKNAGVNKITFDIIFRDRDTYEAVKRSGALTRDSVCRLYAIKPERLSDFVEYDPGLAIKFTIFRERPSSTRLCLACLWRCNKLPHTKPPETTT